MKSLNFDKMAKIYEETRIFDKDSFNKALNYIVERFPPNNYKKVFEPGIGNGRIAIPLAKKGYDVYGIDISFKMLKLLEERLAKIKSNLSISFKEGDATNIPYKDNEFKMAIIVYLFYFIKDWKKAVDEILRVVDGPIILMHTGYGMEIPFLNERYKQLCKENGFSISPIGVESTKEVLAYLKDLGYQIEWVKDRWQWKSYIKLNKAIYYLEKRAYSFTTFPPKNIHDRVIKEIKHEIKEKFEKSDDVIEIFNQVYLIIIQ